MLVDENGMNVVKHYLADNNATRLVMTKNGKQCDCITKNGMSQHKPNINKLAKSY